MSETMTTLTEVLVESAENALSEQRDDGSMPPGHNGPWDDPETPVRNTGHWAITFFHCYERTGDSKFLDAGEDAITYLETDEARPHGETFYHRKSGEKDHCNGLIGQAWSIEAIVVAAEQLGRADLVDLANEVFLLHPFEQDLAAWHPVEIDGTVKPIDMTFNHQLWFAAAGGLLAQHPESNPAVDEQVRRYLDEIEANLNVMGEGLVYHPFKPDFDVRKYGKIFWEGIKSGTAHTMVLGVLQGMIGGEGGDSDGGWTEKAVGYHSFNLYAFALLREAYPNHGIWKSHKIQLTLSYATSEAYADALVGNPYGYPYNCSGIEVAYALDAFGQIDAEDQRRWLERQFDRTYDPETNTMARNNPDPTTLTARLYEAIRLPEVEFDARGEERNE